MVDEATVRGWLAEVSERISANTAQVARLQAEITGDRRREAALKLLLAASTDGSEPEDAATALDSSGDSVGRQNCGVSIHPIEQGATTILEERGKPLHISELRRELARRGIPIPGKGTDANVIVYLSRCSDVCRVGRGLYALRAWNVPEVPARRRRTARKRRKARA